MLLALKFILFALAYYLLSAAIIVGSQAMLKRLDQKERQATTQSISPQRQTT